ncbi:uroporphyrinogen-III C-methyltransferase, partial [Erwinia amylovora]|nr:uroporphyrinogen-III C-methyltransferase [Erwinia amylovora]
VETSTSQPQPPPETRRRGVVPGVIAIAIALAVGAGLYMYGKHQAQLQTAASQTLAAQIAELQQQSFSDKQSLMEKLTAQTSALDTARQQQAAMNQ